MVNFVVLFGRPIKERRRILRENMKEIPNRIMFSEMTHIKVCHIKFIHILSAEMCNRNFNMTQYSFNRAHPNFNMTQYSFNRAHLKELLRFLVEHSQLE